jgi:hypothetical protein
MMTNRIRKDVSPSVVECAIAAKVVSHHRDVAGSNLVTSFQFFLPN